MSFSACPIATVEAPVERVWSLLADPAHYARWWDASGVETQDETQDFAGETQDFASVQHLITPEGPAQPGQKIYARTRGLGRVRAWRQLV